MAPLNTHSVHVAACFHPYLVHCTQQITQIPVCASLTSWIKIPIRLRRMTAECQRPASLKHDASKNREDHSHAIFQITQLAGSSFIPLHTQTRTQSSKPPLACWYWEACTFLRLYPFKQQLCKPFCDNDARIIIVYLHDKTKQK
ncbi:hypothetical protein CSKR_100039 [Clonorchis sinensis]|uniref:Uncharacterized protein n=1 Tax=Clonorchis sinensis TaxID=79923 RepID=A0A8T1M3V1_CLOSI|nr:hypothetical protein CSKR_100039 [Clonorchis sinensis]